MRGRSTKRSFRWLLLVFCFLIASHSFGQIKHIQVLLDYNSVKIPDSLKKYFSKQDFKEFKKGHKTLFSPRSKEVLYIKYYCNDSSGFRLFSEGYHIGDPLLGEGKLFYSNGQIRLIENNILVDELLNPIDLETFNHQSENKRNTMTYKVFPHGEWKLIFQSQLGIAFLKSF